VFDKFTNFALIWIDRFLPRIAPLESPMLHVTAAKYLRDYRVWLTFNDGSSGEVDLSARLHGPMFEPLKDLSLFCQVKFDAEADTIVWPNGADLAPEYLHTLAMRPVSASS
jgi:hypothetical protein